MSHSLPSFFFVKSRNTYVLLVNISLDAQDKDEVAFSPFRPKKLKSKFFARLEETLDSL